MLKSIFLLLTRNDLLASTKCLVMAINSFYTWQEFNALSFVVNYFPSLGHLKYANGIIAISLFPFRFCEGIPLHFCKHACMLLVLSDHFVSRARHRKKCSEILEKEEHVCLFIFHISEPPFFLKDRPFMLVGLEALWLNFLSYRKGFPQNIF